MVEYFFKSIIWCSLFLSKKEEKGQYFFSFLSKVFSQTYITTLFIKLISNLFTPRSYFKG